MAWRKTLEVFDEEQQQTRNLSLFPDDEVPAETLNSLQVNLAGLELRRPRPFGNCWLASELWQQLGLDQFWQAHLPEGREAVSWEKVLRLLVVNRLLEPGSEFGYTGTGSWKARWMSCWKPTSRWPAKTGCIGVWIASSNTSRNSMRPPEAEVGRVVCRRFRSAGDVLLPQPPSAPISRSPRAASSFAPAPPATSEVLRQVIQVTPLPRSRNTAATSATDSAYTA